MFGKALVKSTKVRGGGILLQKVTKATSKQIFRNLSSAVSSFYL